MKKILVTGGPVHAHLDAVKILTNRFKGGLMCELVRQLLGYDVEVVYLCAPKVGAQVPAPHERLTVLTHGGFDDYRRQVLALAPETDGVVLGAAVANLIPANPIVGKFPSHNYQPGDIIPINFKIAPRVIDEVKAAAPKTQLFGCKLLSDVSREELISAAYGVLLESRAMTVFANDAKDLQQKFAVTKERGVHPMNVEGQAAWIWRSLNDVYYSTVFVDGPASTDEAVDKLRATLARYADHFAANEAGLVFGTVAVRCGNGFVTTGRGKRELDSIVHVTHVDHEKKLVKVAGGVKASLNAPLLSQMFYNPAVDVVVHYHEQVPELTTYEYAPPGTVRDSRRLNGNSFNIREHGCILLFDQDGKHLWHREGRRL